ncbi:MAG TPA: sulfatase-like hydrolase/transferase [Chitinophagaceae bacterium]|nr:sulfatase-like hydrolase/transferase [Chitinophagaceae bacterium]
MRVNKLICQTIFLLFIISHLHSQTNEQVSRKPNIIVFLADDLGYGDLACYGNPIIKTPNLDQFAREGVRMTDCHSGGTTCSPSRAALLTGRNPYRSGFYTILDQHNFLADKEVTIAEMLKSVGYTTCFLGKWHLSVLEKKKQHQPDPGNQGFDYWMGTTHNAFDGPGHTKDFIRNNVPVGQADDWFCNILVKEARQWLGNVRDSSKPFFMYIASHEPHTPIAPPKSYSDMYKNARVDSLEKTIQYGHVPRTDRDISANKSEYYGTVTQLDNAFGNLMKVLDSLGLRNNTLVFFTSDNGPEDPVSLEESKGEWKDPIRDKCFGSPGIYRGMKRYVYEGGHRIPGIARFPGVIPAGTTSDKLFDGTDLFPTLCKEAGASLPMHVTIDGKANFNAFLNKKIKRKVPDMWYFPCYEDTYFRLAEMEMRFGNYTLIGWLPPKPDSLSLDEWLYRNVPVRYELYDLSTDPSQQHDIASQKPRMVKRMSKTMAKLWTEMRDEGKLNRH